MAKINSLQEVLVEELRDIYDAEKRLTKAIPKLIKASTSDDLKEGLENHLTETEEQVSRLESAFEQLGETPRAKTCAGMKGLIEEGDEHSGEDYGDDSLRDAVIIGAAQRVEHYEMAAYGTAIAHAKPRPRRGRHAARGDAAGRKGRRREAHRGCRGHRQPAGAYGRRRVRRGRGQQRNGQRRFGQRQPVADVGVWRLVEPFWQLVTLWLGFAQPKQEITAGKGMGDAPSPHPIQSALSLRTSRTIACGR